MSDEPRSPSPLDTLLTRRRLIAATGGAGLAASLAPRVVGHDDEEDHSGDGHDEDDDSGRGRGRGGDDDEVQPQGTVPAGSAEVRITDDDADGFEPGTVTIDAGQSVTWVNLDDDPHTATGAEFDTGIIQPGELATVTFDEPGSFPYSCQIHPVMTGTVEVRDEDGNVPASSSGMASPSASPGATPAATDEPASVTIENVAFNPPEIEVPAGTTVTWTNRENVPHTVTSSDGAFGSDTLNRGDVFSHAFATPGTYDYVCAIHPNMRGSVVVTE